MAVWVVMEGVLATLRVAGRPNDGQDPKPARHENRRAAWNHAEKIASVKKLISHSSEEKQNEDDIKFSLKQWQDFSLCSLG